MTGFDPKAYWSDRLDRTYTLGGVGWLGLGEVFNRWMYRVRRRNFVRTARHAIGTAGRARVLDVGSGTGFYIERWHEVGAAEVSGADLTDVAVGRLRERFAGDTFTQFDLTGTPPDSLVPGHYDAISAIDVLYHIVDDDGYVRAIENLHSLLRPGGMLILTENLVARGVDARRESGRAGHRLDPRAARSHGIRGRAPQADVRPDEHAGRLRQPAAPALLGTPHDAGAAWAARPPGRLARRSTP